MNQERFNIQMNAVVEALIARGYNPYGQITGYLLEKNPVYITSHNGARECVKKLDMKMIQDYINNWDENQDEKWRLEFSRENQR